MRNEGVYFPLASDALVLCEYLRIYACTCECKFVCLLDAVMAITICMFVFAFILCGPPGSFAAIAEGIQGGLSVKVVVN